MRPYLLATDRERLHRLWCLFIACTNGVEGGPFQQDLGPATVMVTQWMLKVGALRNGFTYGKLFHQLEEIVSELLRYLWEIPSDAHQSLSERLLLVRLFCF